MMGRLKEISFRKSVILKGLYALVSLVCSRIVSKPLVLCFHRVKVPTDSLLDKRVGCISPDNFKKVIKFVQLAGYEFVSLEELVSDIERKAFRRVAAVTFDDGFKDLYQNAYPVLKEYGIPLTLFLITSLVDSDHLLWLHRLYLSLDKLDDAESKSILARYSECDGDEDIGEVIGRIIHSSDKKTLLKVVREVAKAAGWSSEDEASIARELYLSKEEIEEMLGNGLTLELHGHEHWPLRSLNEVETKDEIENCVKVIREELKGSANFLSLQYGKDSEHIAPIAEALGLKGMATMEGRLVGRGPLDPYSLPRFCVYDNVQAFYRTLSLEFMKDISHRARRGRREEKRVYRVH